MRHVRFLSNPDARRGVILMVVLALLTLFAVLGLSFVLYANAQSKSSDILLATEEGVGANAIPDISPDTIANAVFTALLYPQDDATGIYSAYRGYDFARSVYGYNYTYNPVTQKTSPVGGNNMPYSGVGRLHEQIKIGGIPVDSYNLVNYTCFQDSNGNPLDVMLDSSNNAGVLRDPERLGVRSSATDLTKLGFYAGGFNVSYTYPDANNLWLGAIRAGAPVDPVTMQPKTGEYGAVLVQSFHRPWLGFGSLDPNNPNWYIPSVALTAFPGPQPPGTPPPPNPALKYMVMRPRPIDQLLANETWDYAKNMPYNLATGKYRTSFFPPPLDAGGDVKNLVGSPGTLINPGPPANYANSDSFWMDFGFPVLTTSNGKKYKPLVAQLIVPMDNVVNVNVNGNVRGNATVPPIGNVSMHASNQGWGPWEVSLSQVLTADTMPPTSNPVPLEWVNLFTGQSGTGIYGRYGPDKVPSSPPSNVAPYSYVSSSFMAPNFGVPRFYGQIDFDAVQTNSTASAPMLLPSDPGNPNPPFFPFPSYPGSSFTNGDPPPSASPFERTNHPLVYNYFQQTGDDRFFQLSNMEAMLRYGDVGADAIRSELMNLCPQNLGANTDVAKKLRRLITTLSMDNDRPAVTPWARTDFATTSPYQLSGLFPTGNSMPFPTAPTGFTGEFGNGSDTRAADAFLGKVDLNRPLTPYPATDVNGLFVGGSGAQLARALADRQQLARDIFDRLRFVTTGESPSIALPAAPAAPPINPTYEAYRWLAQLAANIVDFIDDDDYMTPFQWNPTTTTEYVFGTELPRVVIKQAYAEYTDSASDGYAGTSAYDINFWVELYNPFIPDSTAGRTDAGTARLQVPGAPSGVYQLTIVNAPDNSAAGFRSPDNSLGNPAKAGTTTLATVTAWTPVNTPPAGVDVNIIQPGNRMPSGTPGTNQNGFYVAGPPPYAGGNTAPFPAPPPPPAGQTFETIQLSALRVTVPLAPPSLPAMQYGVYLQRLACPGMPPSTTPGPAYNPYITVDVMAGPTPAGTNSLVPNFAFNKVGGIPKTPTAGTQNEPVATRYAVGRKQPYAGDQSQLAQQTNAPASQPKNSFFTQNAPATSPADWLVHLDRQLVSPVELLYVSAFKPHELTQQFMTATGSFQHQFAVPLVDPPGATSSSRLWRAFEFLATHSRNIQSPTNGRIPGRININNVWDIETWRALCDAQGANHFTSAQVDQMFYDMIQSRSPSAGTYNPTSYFLPSMGDRPFRSSAAPFSLGNGGTVPAAVLDNQYPNGAGEADTLFRLHPTSPRGLFEVPVIPPATSSKPFQKYEVFNKIYNNITTRSNVFAVWTTVGFFEVIDDTTRPVKLGAEIGLAQHQNIRHRFFAIIDRSNLRDPSLSPPVFLKGNSAVNTPTGLGPLPYPNPAAPSATVSVDALSGTYEGTNWQIGVGTQLVVDVGYDVSQAPTPQDVMTSRKELVTVTAVDTVNNTFTAGFTYPHPAGFLINLNTVPGNPGPQPNANPLQDTAVVRYYSVIN